MEKLKIAYKNILSCSTTSLHFYQGTLALPKYFSGISTDTRSCREEDLFVAIAGESFDGFDHLEKVLENASNRILLAVFQSSAKNTQRLLSFQAKYSHISFLEVTNSITFLQELAGHHRDDWMAHSAQNSIIGITGSNGKTTTKEMVAHFFEAIYPKKVLATRGNLNNHIGVPLTLLRLTSQHQIAIIEMGSNHPGEIEALCNIARPHSGIITNIGSAHLEFFKDEEGVFLEKSALYRAIWGRPDRKFFIIPLDDPYLSRLAPFPGAFFFAEKEASSLSDTHSFWQLRFTASNSLVLINRTQNITININNDAVSEKHNLKNLAMALLLAYCYSPNALRELELAGNNFSPPKNNRSMWVTPDNSSVQIFLDAYNANPSSMRASLLYFCEHANANSIDLGECAFILGDMNELGDRCQEFHVEIGSLMAQQKITAAFFIGKYAKFYQQGFGNTGKVFEQKSAFLPLWMEIRKKYRYVFIKGSRSVQLESLV
ncbi:MAG: hypothetical protein A2504_02150 [Bdellovibrionales bacterium RIFOXYD12_FULL_39_22]|nr:MAG: hypothetical protein A2385_12175 [Bdellovibrionales bacterium RIFOXYB1_FULL_39_21]OFZ41398.1 MAG: hypothetical protein A2485_01345 [Bdellovibrionales bacterium RIFOXYC12_FULL_39_17]OFZ45353.1 MAG: hypothetical protein A2404_13360 [Bdellovibrionales bacterium RIFOXYC1_FULL_39_130]OFZ74549.1 MAG: hypothetical protein A2560_12465 [Bdellovibrionales bacterium RIFOXYD1_FULL_39_84]OFZ92558.1 MAG: hypothetical protein A2504_02150 [Bdellovibrionales bacterium RIFOXYD12_FULL_39_22]HLE09704.1 UD